MILKNHVTIDKFVLETAKDSSEFVDYVAKNMAHELAEAMINKIEPGKEYKIKLHESRRLEDPRTCTYEFEKALDLEEYGWIPCSERLPGIGQFVLLSGKIKGGTQIIIVMGDQVRYWQSKLPGLAWMPLPEPWKGADDERP